MQNLFDRKRPDAAKVRGIKDLVSTHFDFVVTMKVARR